MKYRVFTRNRWTANKNYPGGREPGPGPKRLLCRVSTIEEARHVCEQYNKTHKPGFLSRKAEFMAESGVI